jgi:hypothetical protein
VKQKANTMKVVAVDMRDKQMSSYQDKLTHPTQTEDGEMEI